MIFIAAACLCLFMLTGSEAQDCTIPDIDTIRLSLQNEVIQFGQGGEGGTTVNLVDSSNVCQAQGTTRGTYRELSFIMVYTIDSNPTVRRRYFDLMCINAGGGGITGLRPTASNPSQLREAPADYTNIQLRTNCSSCIDTGADDENSCTTCPAACDGLMRCTGDSDSDCCIAFEEDGMCTNTNCISTNFVANEQNNFTCACRFNNENCGSGFLFNATNCSCTLTDICMTTPSPCNNGGTCILNSAPDNFTCNCTGTGFTGPNCSDPVPMPMSSSDTVVMTTPQISSTRMSTTSSSTATTTTMSMSTTTTTTQDSTTVPTSSATPSQSAESAIADDGPLIPAIVVSAFIALLLIIIFIILIIYVIYYALTGRGFEMAKAKANTPFANGESHNNPLYLQPDVVTSEVANLYTPSS